MNLKYYFNGKLCLMKEKSGMRKRCLMKLVGCAFFVYLLTFTVTSILYQNSKRANEVSTSGVISYTQDSRQISYNDDWTHVFDAIYIYSAFWEYRTNPTMVRIIGIGQRLQNYTSQLICLLKYADSSIKVTPAASRNFEDHHEMRLSSKFFYCNASDKPENVALVSTRNANNISWLKVHDTKPMASISKNNIALCTQPLYKNYDNSLTTLNVAEFIAYYEILGINRFVFYDYRADDSVKAFLNRLSQEGLQIEVVPWTFPKEDSWGIWNTGQAASVADCVYKHASSYEYVAIFDFDEYVVPNANVTLQRLLQQLTETNGSNWSSYMFRHTFFCLDYPDDSASRNITPRFVTQTKTLRGKIWEQYFRAKSIVRPNAVVLPGIHYTWEAFPTWNTSFDISPSIALLHHYRRGICGGQQSVDAVNDRTTWRYGSRLLNSKPIKIWKAYSHFRS